MEGAPELCSLFFERLFSHRYAKCFHDPPASACTCLTRPDCVHGPSSLGQIQEKMQAKRYQSSQSLLHDLEIFFDNILTAEAPDTAGYRKATALQKMYQRQRLRMVGAEKEIEAARRPLVPLKSENDSTSDTKIMGPNNSSRTTIKTPKKRSKKIQNVDPGDSSSATPSPKKVRGKRKKRSTTDKRRNRKQPLGTFVKEEVLREIPKDDVDSPPPHTELCVRRTFSRSKFTKFTTVSDEVKMKGKRDYSDEKLGESDYADTEVESDQEEGERRHRKLRRLHLQGKKNKKGSQSTLDSSGEDNRWTQLQHLHRGISNSRKRIIPQSVGSSKRMDRELSGSSSKRLDGELGASDKVQKSRYNLEDLQIKELVALNHPGAGFSNLKAVAATCRGWFRQVNQDRFCLDRIVFPCQKMDFLLHQPKSFQDCSKNRFLLFGVFDGHGSLGHSASQICEHLIPLHLYQDLHSGHSVEKALKHSFEEAHRFILALAEQEKGVSDRIFMAHTGSGISPPSLDYGTTAVVGVLDLETRLCHVANVGDSRCIIFEQSNQGKGDSKAKFETVDHNPTIDAKERNRITVAGGSIINTGQEVRVYPSNISLETAREQNLTINMSRALGHLTLSQYGISATPDVTCTDLSKMSDCYLLSASDGLWSVMSREEVMNTIEGATDVKQACLDLIRESDRRWQGKDVGDNITVVILKVSPETSCELLSKNRDSGSEKSCSSSSPSVPSLSDRTGAGVIDSVSGSGHCGSSAVGSSCSGGSVVSLEQSVT